MFRTFTIKNFRCFRDLTLTDLERVNLIAGKNNVGKTAVLEALLLHVGADNPRLMMDLNDQRGLEQTLADEREVWGWLFFNKQTDLTVELSSEDAGAVNRSLHIDLSKPMETEAGSSQSGPRVVRSPESLPGQPAGQLLTTAVRPDLRVSYQDSLTHEGAATVSVHQANGRVSLSVGSQGTFAPVAALFIGPHSRPGREDAILFSRLVEAGRDSELLAVLKLLDPRLKRLMVLITGGVPVIHGDVGTGAPVPLPMMGDGIVRMLSFLLIMMQIASGVLLVDEIENGFHHSVMVDVWRAIAEAARRADVQVFATTHSWECIRAAQEAFSVDDRTPDFRFLRLERIESEIRAVPFLDDMLGATIELGLEVR